MCDKTLPACTIRANNGMGQRGRPKPPLAAGHIHCPIACPAPPQALAQPHASLHAELRKPWPCNAPRYARVSTSAQGTSDGGQTPHPRHYQHLFPLCCLQDTPTQTQRRMKGRMQRRSPFDSTSVLCLGARLLAARRLSDALIHPTFLGEARADWLAPCDCCALHESGPFGKIKKARLWQIPELRHGLHTFVRRRRGGGHGLRRSSPSPFSHAMRCRSHTYPAHTRPRYALTRSTADRSFCRGCPIWAGAATVFGNGAILRHRPPISPCQSLHVRGSNK